MTEEIQPRQVERFRQNGLRIEDIHHPELMGPEELILMANSLSMLTARAFMRDVSTHDEHERLLEDVRVHIQQSG